MVTIYLAVIQRFYPVLAYNQPVMFFNIMCHFELMIPAYHVARCLTECQHLTVMA